ncbi:tyrosine-protein kinase BAZ1B-like [Dendronephthya gigantea]|uniref:tyrosine-protein kinase BAZ1B-like n=1 Tax=Dendronephthya gigantea TaxID=151771 RepID=UPI00106B2C05|nr:tyrosine-protein kinase BAZ1B-like [Dendronephthya gigantea]
MTPSRLRFCIAMLDYCIIWEASTLFLKCMVCRHGAGVMAVCDHCHKGFHIVCLRPALHDVPDGEWYCPACKRDNERSTRPASCEQTGEIVEDEGEEKNDDYCDVCGGEGEMICCDNCPKVYHKECHDPPLRNIPRGAWKCCSCQGRHPTARKQDLVMESFEYSEFETSQDDSADDSSYSVTLSESESEVEEVVLNRSERAKKRDLIREGKAEPKRSKIKRKNRRGKTSAKDRDEKRSKRKCRGKIRDFLIDDSREGEGKESFPGKKQQRSGNCDPDSDDNNQSSGETLRCSSRKRKCSSSEEDCTVAKRRPRQNPELKMCENLLRDLMRHEDSWPFIEPVDISEVPDYAEIISNPMDFGTIKRKLMAVEYKTYQDCLSDIKLVFSNSDQYNLEISDHGLAGISLEAYFKEILPNYFPKYDLQGARVPKKSSRLRPRKRGY